MSFPQASPALARALVERNYTTLTPVQSAVLAPEAQARDIIVSAQTGSGKTVAYGLAIAPELLGEAERMASVEAPVALVIAPTRELAIQVERELTWLYRDAGARILSCVGGMDARSERRKLADGAHIVVGTPGRLRDHIERGALVLSALKVVVLDEADEMLNMGFREDLEFILEATPGERRTLMFSATMPRGIVNLAKRYQRDALRLEVTATDSGHNDIEYRAIRTAAGETEHVVVNLLRFVEARTAIVFCNTRESVRHLMATLQERGFSVVILSGELSQHERNQSMQALRDGRARVCVATDVAARGIDLPNVGLVIHAEPPHDVEALQHRSGRTGRAGRKGISALLVPPSRRRRIEQLLRDASIRVRWGGPPTIESIHALDQQRLLEDPLFVETPSETDFEMARHLLDERTPEQLAALLVRIYRARLPALEDVSDPGDAPQKREPRGPRGEATGAHMQSPAQSPGSKGGFERGPSDKQSGRADFGAAAWFSIDVGRAKKADPKWLLPMLCRKGGIERKDIGAIRIFDHETRVEIAEPVAAAFLTRFRQPGGEPFGIEPAPDGMGPRETRPATPRKFEERKFEDRKFDKAGAKERHFEDKPFRKPVRPRTEPAGDVAPVLTPQPWKAAKPAKFAGTGKGDKYGKGGKSEKGSKPEKHGKPDKASTPFRIRKKERKARAGS